MANTLNRTYSLDAFRSKKIALMGAILGIAALAACGPKEAPQPQALETTAAGGELTPTPQPSEANVAGNMVTSVPQMDEQALKYTDNYFTDKTGDPERDNRYLGARFGAYYYDVVGKNGLCITKFQAELNNKARQGIIGADEEWMQLDSANYNEFIGPATVAKKLEGPSLAMIEAAATDEDCPEANNTKVVSFMHNGQQYSTSAKELLFHLEGDIEAAREQYTIAAGIGATNVSNESLQVIAKTTEKDLERRIEIGDVSNDGVVDADDISSRQITLLPLLQKKEATLEMLDRYGYIA